MLKEGWDLPALDQAMRHRGACRDILLFVASSPNEGIPHGATPGRSLAEIMKHLRPMHPDTAIEFVHRLANRKLLGMNVEGYYVTSQGHAKLAQKIVSDVRSVS